MKKILSVVAGFGLLCASIFAGDPVSLHLNDAVQGIGSRCILPPHGNEMIPAWTAGVVVVAGQLLYNSSNTTYLVVQRLSGNTTNMPADLAPDCFLVDSNIYYRAVGPCKNLRRGFVISNISTGRLFVAIGQAAVTNKGVYLAAGASWTCDNNPFQEALHVISGNTNCYVTAHEW